MVTRLTSVDVIRNPKQDLLQAQNLVAAANSNNGGKRRDLYRLFKCEDISAIKTQHEGLQVQTNLRKIRI